MVRLITATWRGIRRVEAADVRRVGGRGGGLALETRESSGSEPAPKIAPKTFLLVDVKPSVRTHLPANLGGHSIIINAFPTFKTR